MMKKMIPLLATVLLTVSCASTGINRGKEPAKSSPPVITEAYAAKEMRLGDIWRVYLKASAPEGPMHYIVATIDQPGRGSGYPPSFIRIKREQRQGLSGFIYLKTGVQQGLEFTNITLSVQIRDRNGNMSNPAVFPLHFRMKAVQEPPPPGVFKEEELGPVMIRIRPLGDDGQNR